MLGPAKFEGLVERHGQHREMRTHIVLSTQHERPAVPRPLTSTAIEVLR